MDDNRDQKGQFKPGHNAGGRPPNAENKVNRNIKEAYQNLIESNLDNLSEWLKRTAEQNPKQALEVILRLSEFVLPKRTNMTLNSLNDLSDDELDFLIEKITKNGNNGKYE